MKNVLRVVLKEAEYESEKISVWVGFAGGEEYE